MTNLSFESAPINDNGEPLVNLADYPFVCEPVYYKQGLSKTPLMQLRRGVADKLLRIQQTFNDQYRFKIWDGYRPRAVQQAIYQSFWDDLARKHPDWDEQRLAIETQTFVTSATTKGRIPPHATGGAIDLTLVDANDKELDMGSGFDHFGPESKPNYFEINPTNAVAQQNRHTLQKALFDAGFTIDADEWWHFDYGNQSWATRSSQDHALYGEA